MTICDNCKGEGLVGQGDRPWAKEGRIETCKVCSGTGKVNVAVAAPEAPTEVPNEPVNIPEEASVDNQPEPSEPKPGFIERVVDKILG